MKTEKQTHCNNPSCLKELVHTEGRRPKKYCSPSCRNAHYKIVYEKKKKVVLVEDENGQWQTSDGRKVKFEWQDLNVSNNPEPDPVKAGYVMPEIKVRRSYDDLLSEAKTGVVDMEKFKSDLNHSSCTPGQKEMILSKIKTQ